MHTGRLTALLLPAGILLIAWGYYLLAVPPDATADEMLDRAQNGMLAVVGGGTFLMLRMAKR